LLCLDPALSRGGVPGAAPRRGTPVRGLRLPAERRFVGLQEIFATSPLAVVSLDEITDNVVASLAADEARKRALLDRWVKGPFKSFAKGAYAMDGTAMRRALQSGETVYLAAVLRKVVAG
jgi:hypothetical protein